MIEISIIVPVYNLEEYLPKCVDSILGQTFTNFELILVNDGSTDNSGELCDAYARIDSRVKVIHKENGGVASSRNAGLVIAEGNYIGFVDNDDYINEHMFEILYKNAKHYSSDIVVCDYVNVYEDHPTEIQTSDVNDEAQHYNNIEALHQLYTDNNVTFVVPWNKLYRKDLFDDIKYKVGSINDDENIVHELLYHSHKITYIQAGLYYYVQRSGSQMDSNASFHVKKLDAVYAFSDREKFFREAKEKELHKKALKQYMERFFRYYYMAKSNLSNVDQELKLLKYTFDKRLIYLLRHQGIGWKQKFMCVVFRINPSLFEFMRDTIISREQQKSA